MNELPRLLIISELVPQSILAGSILLLRLLKDYPPDKLLVIGAPATAEAECLTCRYEELNLPLERFNRTRLARLVRSLRSINLLPQLILASIQQRLQGFQPEVILSVMEVQPYYHLAYRYAKSHRLPLVLIVHDIPEVFEPVYPWALQPQRDRNAEIYRYATQRLCVSPQMRDFFVKRYGISGNVLYPNRSEALVCRPLANVRQLKQPGTLTLGYAGTLAYGYGEQLSRMLPSFRETGTALRVYSRDRSLGMAPDGVTYGDYAVQPDQTWLRIKQECDGLILPYCWSEDNGQQDLYKTHFPSKLTEYLALGMPILIVGPSYATGVQWGLQNCDATLVVTENDPGAWREALNQLKDADTRERLSGGAIVAGDRDFNPVRLRQQFLTYLQAATSSGITSFNVSKNP